MKAMIFAAGLGTRFKPWTDLHPKALAPINGKSLLQRNIEYLQTAGIREVIVNIHHFGEQIVSEIKKNQGWGSSVTISDESDVVLETGGGLKKAAWFFDNGPFVVINADILTNLPLAEMIRAHQASKALVTLAVTDRPSSRFFLFNAAQELCGWTNTKTGDLRIVTLSDGLKEKAFSGIHVISPAIFPLIQQTGKFSIVDTYLDLITDQLIKGFDHSGGKLIDVGKPEAVREAERMFV